MGNGNDFGNRCINEKTIVSKNLAWQGRIEAEEFAEEVVEDVVEDVVEESRTLQRADW